MTIYLNLSTLYYNTVVAWKQRLANCILTGLIGNAIYVKKSKVCLTYKIIKCRMKIIDENAYNENIPIEHMVTIQMK